MLLDALVLGAPVPPDVAARADASASGESTFLSLRDVPGTWTLTVRGGVLVALDAFVRGDFDALAPLYDSLATTLRARLGAPTDAPPDDDAQRFVPLEPVERPDDRYWRLRSVAWSDARDRASVSLHVTWPANVDLRLALARA